MKPKRFFLTIFGITLLTIASKGVGFLRDILMAASYGTSIQSDAFIMAQSIVYIISTLVITSLTVAFIPLLSDYMANKSKNEYQSLINNVYSFTICITTILVILTYLLLDPLVNLFAPGFAVGVKALTKNIIIIMLPTIIITAIVLLNNCYLQTKGRFYIPSLIGFPSNLALIIALIFFSNSFGIIGLAFAFTFGAIFQWIFQQSSLRKTQFRFKVEFDFSNDGIKQLLGLIVPTVIGSSVEIINTTVDRIVGSTLPQGSIAALNFSGKLSAFVLGIAGASVTTLFYTAMSHHSANDDRDEFNRLLNKTFVTLSLLILPASAGFIVLRYPIVKLIFERGAFDKNAIEMTSTCLMYFSVGMIGFTLRDILTRSFYAIKDTISPMINGIICVTLNVILIVILPKYYGVGGIALATSISGLMALVLLTIIFYKKYGDFGVRAIVFTLSKILLSTFCMGILVNFIYTSLVKIIDSLIINTFMSIVSGIIIYSICLYILKVEEFICIVNRGLNKALRVAQKR